MRMTPKLGKEKAYLLASGDRLSLFGSSRDLTQSLPSSKVVLPAVPLFKLHVDCDVEPLAQGLYLVESIPSSQLIAQLCESDRWLIERIILEHWKRGEEAIHW